MGKMVVDLHAAIDASANLDFVDSTKIFVVGYSLGATVGLYAAALDKRIAGVVSVCGNSIERGKRKTCLVLSNSSS